MGNNTFFCSCLFPRHSTTMVSPEVAPPAIDSQCCRSSPSITVYYNSFSSEFYFLAIFSVPLSLSPFRTSRNENACFCVSAECTTNNAEGNGPRKKIHSTAAAIAKVAILLMCVHRANTIDCVRAAVCTSSLFRFSAWRKRIVCDRAFSRV